MEQLGVLARLITLRSMVQVHLPLPITVEEVSEPEPDFVAGSDVGVTSPATNHDNKIPRYQDF